VGPEGGFEEAEIEAARELGYAIVGLGPRLLRAETAALAALSAVGYAVGDLA
jgi:16S rRNA (uracil1498-N3)-methyltransferase